MTIVAAPSLTSTQSLSLTTTPTMSAAPTPRPKGPPPPLPADLSNMSVTQLGNLFNDIATYDASKIQGSLNTLGMAALQKSGGEFAISTSAFTLKMKALDSTAPAAIQLGTTNVAIPPLASLGTGLAASAIQWTSNPYSDMNTMVPDTLPLSLSVLGENGKHISVKNLTKPVSFSFSLNTSDSKFMAAPYYLAQCAMNQIYVKNGGFYMISEDAIQTGRGTWNVPCQMDKWISVNCTSFGKDSIVSQQCPSLILTPNCLYWDATNSRWSSDGCSPTLINSSVQCSCTHLTDFTTRIDAMAEANKQLFLNAGNVYSIAGLLRYAQWYGTFGGIALMTVLLGMISLRIDIHTTQKYVTYLCRDEVINRVFDNAPNSAIYIYDAKSTKKCAKKIIKKDELPKEVNICQRIMQQHSRIQFLFRYDPRLARIFRLLALFTIQFHSLFVSALFYGFTYGGSGKEGMMWYDIIALAIITSAVNIPVISTLLYNLNNVGISEFKMKFPLLYEEYERRSKFEKYALAYLKLKDGGVHEDVEEEKEAQNAIMDDDQESLLDRLLMYLCCKNPPEKKEDETSTMTRKDLLVKMIKVIKAKYPGFEVYPSYWSYLPCHTSQAWLFLICAGGWLAWCLNYLLLFAASHEQSVGEKIMISYATSELTTIFLTQPLSIVVTYIVYKAINKYGDYLPAWVKTLAINSNKKNVRGLYFFSNPWSNMAESTFTYKFAYSLFVKCPAKASNTSELAYAPTKAVIHDVEEEQICEVEKLYNDIMEVKNELRLRQVR